MGPALRANREQAIAEIEGAAGADAFARYGGYRLIAETEPACPDPRYLRLMDAALQMMYDRGLSSGHMTRYEADQRIATHGDLRTSFDRIAEVASPPPGAPDLAVAPGSALLVARMGPDQLDNQFWIERTDDNAYEVFSMRRRDDDSTTLTRYSEDSIGRSATADGTLRALGS